jgi:pyruvate,water dikinase
MEPTYIRWFDELSITDIPIVGGKNASLGELMQRLRGEGVRVPQGFAITVDAYRDLLRDYELDSFIRTELARHDLRDVRQLSKCGAAIRQAITAASFSPELTDAISNAYHELISRAGGITDVAVRSSATAEDLPSASFAGQLESFLHVQGIDHLMQCCHRCFASLFTDRAISYRVDKGFDHRAAAVSIGVQTMVRSDCGSAGVIFSIDTESGLSSVVIITGSYGLGEAIVQGRVVPDEFVVSKATLRPPYRPIIAKSCGSKKVQIVYDEMAEHHIAEVPVPAEKRGLFVLSDDDILTLARWAVDIERHYSKRAGQPTPMDIEWAKDGVTGELYVVQARPETVVTRRDPAVVKTKRLQRRGPIAVTGRAVGQGIGAGPADVIRSVDEIEKFISGSVLVTEATDPNWEPIMKSAAAIVTEKGGRTSHAAIVSRELGIPCIVGATGAISAISNGEEVTVSCAEGDEGRVYRGLLPFTEEEIDLRKLEKPKCRVMLNIGDPDNAFRYSFLPVDGVGLTRIEFIVSSYIRVHPLALIHIDRVASGDERNEIERLTAGYREPRDYFVEQLASGIGKIAAAFHPREVIVRMSDFKTNEYANLLGGKSFEPREENPMLGWRGASRYYDAGYREGFSLECGAITRVRERFGFTNVSVMIPFCRTPEEASRVLEEMKVNGIERGKNGLAVYGMCEIPSNVLMADQFLDLFDGYSIGSNDLTQLTLGLDRDSAMVAHLFDERNPAVKRLVSDVIRACRERGKYIGICGDAPSTYPEFARFLIEAGIESISLSPDAVFPIYLALASKGISEQWNE